MFSVSNMITISFIQLFNVMLENVYIFLWKSYLSGEIRNTIVFLTHFNIIRKKKRKAFSYSHLLDF